MWFDYLNGKLMPGDMFVRGAQGPYYPEVLYYADLPDNSGGAYTGKLYVVLNTTGFWPIRKLSGFYVGRATTWEYLGNMTLGGAGDYDPAGITEGQAIAWESASSGYKPKSFEALRTYTGSIIGTAVDLITAIFELDEALTTVEYPVTAVAAGSWTVESGTVADLDSLADSGMVFIEPAGVSNSFVELQIDNVVHLTNMHAHYRYYSTSGNTSHTPVWEMFNYTLSGGVGAWENTGISVALNTSLVDLFNKVIENGADYISADANKRVRFRFSHPQAGIGTHRLLLKHVIASKGPTAVVTSQSHNALGDRDLENQHPGTAIAINAAAFADTSIVNDQLLAEKVDGFRLIDWANPVSVTTTANLTIGNHHVCTGTTADYTVTLPAVAGNEGKLISIEMSGAMTKLITVEGNASETIDGALNRVMWARETAVLLCNGTTWTKVCGKSIPSVVHAYITADQLNIGTAAYVLCNLSATSVLSGCFTLSGGVLTLKRPMNFNFFGRVAWKGLTSPSTKEYWASLYKNGVFNGSNFAAPNASTAPASLLIGTAVGWASGDTAGLYAGSFSDATADVDSGSSHPAATFLEIMEAPQW